MTPEERREHTRDKVRRFRERQKTGAPTPPRKKRHAEASISGIIDAGAVDAEASKIVQRTQRIPLQIITRLNDIAAAMNLVKIDIETAAMEKELTRLEKEYEKKHGRPVPPAPPGKGIKKHVRNKPK
jgi:hypothetical protein